MLVTVRNSFPILCDLRVKFVADEEDPDLLNCVVDLQVTSDELPLGEEDCNVAFRRLTLSVSNEGMEIISGSRYGEPKKKNAVPMTDKATQKNTTKIMRSLGLAGSTDTGVVGKAAVGREHGTEFESEKSYHEDGEHLRVKAKPNDRWEITEPGGAPLDCTYLLGDKLFSASRNNLANRNTATIELKVKQRDLAINGKFAGAKPPKFLKSLSENQRRLLDIFICKSLSKMCYGDRSYAGEIVVADFEYVHTDEE